MFSKISIGGILFALAGSANAAVWGTGVDNALDLQGSRTSGVGGGVTATEQWDNSGFTIAWDVFQNTTNTWQYDYTISITDVQGQIKDVSHFILEVTNDSLPFSILNGTSEPIEGPGFYSDTSGNGNGNNNSSNPGLPNEMYGVKFDFGSESGSVTYSIVTDRSPVWGVFYAKDGRNGNSDIYAFANALSNEYYMTDETLTTNDFIVRPDGTVSAVPLPAAFWLLGSACIALFGFSRQKNAFGRTLFSRS